MWTAQWSITASHYHGRAQAAICRYAKHRRVTVFQTMFGFYLSSSRLQPRPAVANRAAAIGWEDESRFLLLLEPGTQLVAHASINLATCTHTHTHAHTPTHPHTPTHTHTPTHKHRAGYHLGSRCVIEPSRRKPACWDSPPIGPFTRHAHMHLCAGLSLDGPQKHKWVHVQSLI